MRAVKLTYLLLDFLKNHDHLLLKISKMNFKAWLFVCLFFLLLPKPLFAEECRVFFGPSSSKVNFLNIIKDKNNNFLDRKRAFFNLFQLMFDQKYSYKKDEFDDVIRSMQSFSKEEQTHIAAEMKPWKDHLANSALIARLSRALFNQDAQTIEKILDSKWVKIFNLDLIIKESWTNETAKDMALNFEFKDIAALLEEAEKEQ